MKIEPHYLDTLDALVAQLKTAQTPESYYVYAALRSLVQDLLADLSTEEFQLRTYPEGQLKGLLLYGRQAAFLHTGADRDKDLREAEICIMKARSVQ
jgi:hypothetical protein